MPTVTCRIISLNPTIASCGRFHYHSHVPGEEIKAQGSQNLHEVIKPVQSKAGSQAAQIHSLPPTLSPCLLPHATGLAHKSD